MRLRTCRGQSLQEIESKGVEEWLTGIPTGVTQQDGSTATGAAGDDPQARGRRAATRHSDHACVRKRIRDRVVQTAAKLVLEPVFEADLDPSAYGYRPKRSAQDAIREVHELVC